MGIPTYRPVLLATDIMHILSILRKEMPSTKATQVAIAKLALYEFKIKNNILRPQYEIQSIEDKLILKTQKFEHDLGLNLSEEIDSLNKKSIASSKDNKLNAFEKWESDPQSCSTEELRLASLYRIDNGLDEEFNAMSVQEQMERLNQLGD